MTEENIIRVFKENEKLGDAFDELDKRINEIIKKYQLNYYELFGILECMKCDLYNQDFKEGELEEK